jgi:hypothetical protein
MYSIVRWTARDFRAAALRTILYSGGAMDDVTGDTGG